MNIKIPYIILKEANGYAAYSPALELATGGKSVAEAKRMFREAADLFIDDLKERKELENYLTEMGWIKKGKKYVPPFEIVQQEEEQVLLYA